MFSIFFDGDYISWPKLHYVCLIGVACNIGIQIYNRKYLNVRQILILGASIKCPVLYCVANHWLIASLQIGCNYLPTLLNWILWLWRAIIDLILIKLFWIHLKATVTSELSVWKRNGTKHLKLIKHQEGLLFLD